MPREGERKETSYNNKKGFQPTTHGQKEVLGCLRGLPQKLLEVAPTPHAALLSCSRREAAAGT